MKVLSPSNRRALLEYIADREAQRASENPEAFNKDVKDITLMQRAGAMTGEMAKFYLAVAVLEFSNCLQTGDATKCTQFMESLKDPVGHIGFAIFMKGNKMTIDMAQFVTRGRIKSRDGKLYGTCWRDDGTDCFPRSLLPSAHTRVA